MAKNNENRLFDTPSLVTLCTPLPPSGKMGGVYDVVQFLTGVEVTEYVPELFEEAKREVFRQHEAINLEAAWAPDKIPAKGAVKGWKRLQGEIFGPQMYLKRPALALRREAEISLAS